MKKNEVVSEAQPSNYLPNLVRVSSIVEYFFPFGGNERERFNSWLAKYGVTHTEYMEEACTGGTLVHKKLEEYSLTKKVYKGTKYKGFVDAGIQFLIDYKVTPIATEEYIRCKDYQGTIDLVGNIDGEDWILDYKSWGLAKYAFNIPISTYTKPYSKLKKARLQLSLYAKAKRIKNIGIIELTPTGYHFHKLELLPTKELNRIIKEYNLRYADEL